MHRFTILESTIIGFFVGVVISTYSLFLDSTDGYISPVLHYISLRQFLYSILPSINTNYIFGFISIVFVYIFYGIIAGILIRKSDKALFFVISIIIILFAIVGYQQLTGVAPTQITPIISSVIISHPVIKNDGPQVSQQYFGNEVTGDLNGDGVADVAFIIPRSDPDRGLLYYLTSAIATSTGHIGTNLLFLGNNVNPQVISITNRIIDVSYLDSTNKTSTTTKDFYAKVTNGKLEQVVQK